MLGVVVKRDNRPSDPVESIQDAFSGWSVGGSGWTARFQVEFLCLRLSFPYFTTFSNSIRFYANAKLIVY